MVPPSFLQKGDQATLAAHNLPNSLDTGNAFVVPTSSRSIDLYII